MPEADQPRAENPKQIIITKIPACAEASAGRQNSKQ